MKKILLVEDDMSLINGLLLRFRYKGLKKCL